MPMKLNSFGLETPVRSSGIQLIKKQRKGVKIMKQKEISKWLKGISILIGLMGAVIFFLFIPMLAIEAKTSYPELAHLFWKGLAFMWATAAGCYASLVIFWKVSNEIAKDNSFSKENARYFAWISRITVGIAIWWFIAFLFLGFSHLMNFTLQLLVLVVVLVFIAVSILSAALSHLIWKAYEMKQENELTI